MAMAATIHGEDLFDALEDVKPLILAHAGEADREKRLPEQVATALRDAGFFRMFRPRSRGGLGMDPVTEFRIGEAMARIDSAAAWNVQVCDTGELFGGWFGDDASATPSASMATVSRRRFSPQFQRANARSWRTGTRWG